MRFLVDNALSPQLADVLKLAGYDAVHVNEYAMGTSSDEAIFRRALNETRIVISADTDFGRIVALQGSTQPSVIVFRWPSLRRPHDQASVLLNNMPSIAPDLERGSLVIIEQTRIRVRQLPIRRIPD